MANASDWIRAQSHAEDLRHSRPHDSQRFGRRCRFQLRLELGGSERARAIVPRDVFAFSNAGGRARDQRYCVRRTRTRADETRCLSCGVAALVERSSNRSFSARLNRLASTAWSWLIVPTSHGRRLRGIEFRSVTVRAFKGKEGPCLDHSQAVIYRGPWKKVVDDDGHTLHRGVPMAVCDKTFRIYSAAPYRDQIVPVPPP